jgi:hypothetical protein
MKAAFDSKGVFQQLLAALPTEYSTIRDAIDRGIKDIDDDLQRLKEKESELRAESSERSLLVRS